MFTAHQACLLEDSEMLGDRRLRNARMVGQELIVAMNGLTPDASLRRRVRAGEVGGVLAAK